MNKKNILVVGGTGFIGYHLIKFLLKKNFNVTSISTKKPKKIRKLAKVNYIRCNTLRIKELNKIKKNYDYIVNLSGYVDHSNKILTYKSHYVGCINLFKVFNHPNLKTFVQIGSSLEYGKLKSPQIEEKIKRPFSIYAKSKLLATKFFLKKFKLINFPIVILRAYQIYGPRQDNNRLISNVIINCLKGSSFSCSKGNQLRDFLYIDDFVASIYKSLNSKEAQGNVINIGSGKPISVKKIIFKIISIIKKGKPQFGKISLRKDEIMELYPSIVKAYKILKWKPKISLDNGLKRTISFYKQ